MAKRKQLDVPWWFALLCAGFVLLVLLTRPYARQWLWPVLFS